MPEILETAESYLKALVAPNAIVIDRDSAVLQWALSGLGERQLLGLRLSREWGGAGVSASTFNQFQELVAQYSGALAFLQTQHQSAGAMLLHSKNEALKQAYLPQMSTGQKLVGIGFSHLRRSPPSLQAEIVSDGYRLNGTVPWVTGFGYFQTFLAAAALPDGCAVFGMVPFKDRSTAPAASGIAKSNQVADGFIRFSEPFSLAAMTATNTVQAEFENWFLADEQVVVVRPPRWIEANDRRNVLRPAFLPLGCARAGLEIVAASRKRETLTFIDETLQQLDGELTTCRDRILQLQTQPTVDFAQALAARSHAIDLAVRCAQAAIAVSSGAANSAEHPAQRVYREALVWMVSGQTPPLMAATLNCLTSDTSPNVEE